MPHSKAVRLELSEIERSELERLVRRHKTAQALALRARIILLAANGLTNTTIAARLGVDLHRVGRWRQRFAGLRLDGLFDEPRSGASRNIGDEAIAETIRRTLETRPAGGDPLEPALEVSGERLCALDGPPHLAPHWSAATLHGDLQAVHRSPVRGKVRDIAGWYLVPPDRAVVLCVDEKTQVQAPGRTQPLLPMRPGQAALDVKLGTIHGAASRATAELEAAIHDYIAVTNATPKPFRWTKTADDILASIHRFCLRTAPQPTLLTTSESAHYCTGSKRWYRPIMAGLQMVEAARPNIRQASHGLAALEPFNLKTSSRC